MDRPRPGCSQAWGRFCDSFFRCCLLTFTVLYLQAAALEEAIQREWQTATSLDNLGFNLYRAIWPDGRRTRLNGELVPSQAAGSPLGAACSRLDTEVEPGATHYHWLGEEDMAGRAAQHGPVSAGAGTLPGWAFLRTLAVLRWTSQV